MKLLHKIKEKGLYGCFNFVKIKLIHVVNYFMLKYYAGLPVDENSIVLESEGDCCDNSYALFDHMQSNGYLKKYKVTWLVDHPENYEDEENLKYVQKNICGHISPDTIKALRTCRWYIYDHCDIMTEMMGRKNDNCTIIYLGHGLRNKKSNSVVRISADYIITTGVMTKIAHQILDNFDENKILTLGYPRLDYLNMSTVQEKYANKKLFGYENYKKIFLWMPTFRQSVNSNLSLDYEECETGISCVPKWDDFDLLNRLFRINNDVLILKVHHLQKRLKLFNENYSNIKFLSDDDIKQRGLQLYQFIPITDALITDYSSIFADYLLMDKPMIFTLNDLKKYENYRGLWPENYIDYLTGYHTYSMKELIDSIKDISEGKDIYSSERKAMITQFHSHVEGGASQRILEYFNL